MHDDSKTEPRISVCMAAYNGSLHIEEQISSILSELGPQDELVIVDDCSTDRTIELIAGMVDRRIRLVRTSRNMGYVKTFERALQEARGEYVFLSDQDDIWIPGRVQLMLGALEEVALVVSNCKHIEGIPGRFQSIRLREKDSTHTFRNAFGILVGYRLHWGCAMAFRRSLLAQVLPFPTYMKESHDQWIAMAGIANRSVRYLETDTILHRLHGQNLTPKGIRGFRQIFAARVAFLRNWVTATRRARGAALALDRSPIAS
ncbi:glycosyltransferase involved in cell wall biosynthesis [Arthrobacter sp. B2I5]|uniref:glycosyltransferase n=1 Tax=Arthrobacter sp. B2I5 TaxID=3042266 RepID=UPI00277F4107|nr:glycosyltransferase [Arthrobacter sp. B2I5]MDQ0825145.1 glycosyltransferase involved in cell wall biosynthesis [Arthrobacter sp. B2I5]